VAPVAVIPAGALGQFLPEILLIFISLMRVGVLELMEMEAPVVKAVALAGGREEHVEVDLEGLKTHAHLIVDSIMAAMDMVVEGPLVAVQSLILLPVVEPEAEADEEILVVEAEAEDPGAQAEQVVPEARVGQHHPGVQEIRGPLQVLLR